MAFSNGKDSVSFEDLKNKVTDSDLVSYYLGITEVPCFIHSPLRKDSKPSFGLYSRDGNRIYWTDLATGERGGIYDLLSLMWHCTYRDTLVRVQQDMKEFIGGTRVSSYTPCTVREPSTKSDSDLQCKVREWRQYDIDYWSSYGVPLEWLKYADVYPISHKIVISDGKRYVFGADKLAYAFVERKEGRVTLKIYQPFNKANHKWSNKHDRSVISLWTKIPEIGDKVCICSSLKDALCLWANTGIPSLAVQGEGYGISATAISELKRRYRYVYIIFDNDETGLTDGEKLAKQTGFTNIVLPKFNGGKDISDLFKTVGKQQFCKTITSLFPYEEEDDPFKMPFD